MSATLGRIGGLAGPPFIWTLVLLAGLAVAPEGGRRVAVILAWSAGAVVSAAAIIQAVDAPRTRLIRQLALIAVVASITLFADGATSVLGQAFVLVVLSG